MTERKPRLLDLYCGAGGAGMGYHRAGFEVVGVDIEPQPRYPFEFHQADALDVLESIANGGHWYYAIGEPDAFHASPPCPRYSSISRVHGVADLHPDLIAPTRAALNAFPEIPYVIENVIGSPLVDATTLCGAAFGLGATCRDGRWRDLRRHRLFEASFVIYSSGCACDGSEPIGVYGSGGAQQKTVRNGGRNRGYMGAFAERVEAMGIDWMSNKELSDAIPPAYTELVGEQLLAALRIGAEA